MRPITNERELTILHFNDVYHISDHELVARFATILRDPNLVLENTNTVNKESLILRIFSGDAFSPSLEAAVLQGHHMVPVLNNLSIDIACYGNHDFDFGEAQLNELSVQCNFPWTLANAVSRHTSTETQMLARALEHVVKDVGGYRIGFFGLAGTDWPSNCQHLPSCDIISPSATARQTARHLRLSEKCDVVIAITHMRLAEDLEVSNSTASGDEKIDLLLGGHDHNVVRRELDNQNANPEIMHRQRHDSSINQTFCSDVLRIVKSGTDWRGLSVIKLKLGRLHGVTAYIENMSTTQILDIPKLPVFRQISPCPSMLETLRSVHDKIETIVTQPLLRTTIPLDGRMSIVRSQETNLGNMLADVVRAFYDTDISFVNSGAIRCDRVVQCSDGFPLCIRDVIEISPFDNAFVVKNVSGSMLKEALENSISDAHTDGRFLQLSGLSIVADWHQPEGQRVESIVYHGKYDRIEPLQTDRYYTVAMVDFIGSGFDGYTCFRNAETIVDAEGAMTDTNMLLEVFKSEMSSSKAELEDEHTAGIRRARRAIIHEYSAADGLPVVNPNLENRIQFTGVVPSGDEGSRYMPC